MEVTLILSVLSVLTAVLVPSIGDYVSDARRVRARGDAQVLASALARFVFDVSTRRGHSAAWPDCDILVGEGDTPAAGSAAGVEGWLGPLGAPHACSMHEHLMNNGAGYAPAVGAGTAWRQGWAGPYLGLGVGPDPWGHRYAANIRHLADGTAFDTVVLSAGPDGVVDTPFAADGTVPGGDDIVVVLAADGR